MGSVPPPNRLALRPQLPLIAPIVRIGFATLITIAMVLAAQAIPFTPLGRFVVDWLFFLDAGHRMKCGQIPHADFSSPIGALGLVLPHVAGQLLPSVQPFFGANLLMWLLALPAALTRMLDLEPVRGAKLVLDHGRTVGDTAPEAAAGMLAEVDGVFVPTCPLDHKVPLLRKPYESVLVLEFERIVLTASWELHLRRRLPGSETTSDTKGGLS